jgi:hypothetical protein
MSDGTGSDTFMFAAGFGADRISDFDANAAGGQNFLNVAALGISDFNTQVSIADAGGDTLVTIGADTITLLNVAWTDVTVSDFYLV